VVGRPVAARADYVYSDALKAKGGVWSPEAINRYLIDPQAFAQGSDMEASAPTRPSGRRSSLIWRDCDKDHS
jgi:cytochrome c